MDLEFSGPSWFWKSPATWYFVNVPEEQSDNLEATATSVSYGWGMIPVTVQIGETEWETSLWPKDERYIVPLEADVREAQDLKEGDTVTVRLAVRI
jgi:hypothetical protein